MKLGIKILISVLLFMNFSSGQSPEKIHYLKISTNPSGVDIYTETKNPDFTKNPDYKDGVFIPVSKGKKQVLVTLFKKDYKDTTLKVNLSKKDTSFLIVSLRPSYSENFLMAQEFLLKRREKKNLGKKIITSSIIPFVLGGVSLGYAQYQIGKANSNKKKIENTLIQNDYQYKKLKEDFSDSRRKSQTSKNLGIISFVLGGTLLSVGLYLNF